MRPVATLLALLVALFAALPGAAQAAPRAEPKVVLIVGPAGQATDQYRELAEDAARVAERHTSNVIRLYSPDATWPAVKQALDGAAVVVYLGHGNGWPSRYRDSLYGTTQNGFGLNPVAGGGDDAYQYFGEDRIASEIVLADNAVVLLHRLCYASGNTEPGLPEGTVDQARQRVDNYAAGFVRAGAGAVVADAFTPPGWYVQRLLTGDRSIESVWRSSPNAKDNELGFDSTRSPGYAGAMDPDRPDGGFYRSIVYRGGVGAGALQASPLAADAPAPPAEPTLIGTGLQLETPYLKERPVAGASTSLWFPYVADDPAGLRGVTVGVRWDPIDVDEPSTGEDGTAGQEPSEPVQPEEPASPDPASPDPAAPAPVSSPDPGSSAPPAAPDDPSRSRLMDIEPERIGDVVEPVPATVGATRMVVDVTLPDRPGRYRLVVTLHDPTGVAYDAPTQTLATGGIVRISGELGARYQVAATARAEASGKLKLPVTVANVGRATWGQAGTPNHRSLEERPSAASLVAHWVSLDGGAEAALPADVEHELPAGMAAGQRKRGILGLEVPAEPGSYLVVLDIVLPDIGSLTAEGVEPGLVRVTVE